MKTTAKILFYFPLLFTLFSCNTDQNYTDPQDTPTAGKINISVDETVKPLMETEEATFESIYTRAHVTTKYGPEANVFSDLINDSARIIVVTRDLTKEERKFFEEEKIVPKTTKIAFDAVAVILNKNNKDSLLTIDQIKGLISGTITTWKEIKKEAPNSPVELIFDNKNSGIIDYLKKFSGTNALPKQNVYALDSSRQVIDYVSKKKNAIGFIGLSWISDTDDSLSNSFLNSITVAEISPADTSAGAGYHYKPYQVNIAQKFYPLMRSIYIISREARAGLGTGFAAFIAGDKGQRIALKLGLIPATMPVRIVELDQEEL